MLNHTAKRVDSDPSNHKIGNIFVDSSVKNLSVIRAEVKFTDFLVEQNRPLSPLHILPPHDLRPIFYFEMLACLGIYIKSLEPKRAEV